ncbi:prepilin-type N-terminal cleavage/methylation domain-containing protein [Opitutaceae bacterium TAV1]|nr:prepilin-type N-terminal cleavage/methylation domain-containing protein [Opitutaceae bacterium TAV1]
MKRKTKSTKGFTLVEMLGVLAIIAILISVISIGVMSAINRARIVSTRANFKTYETALIAYIAMPQSGGNIPRTDGTAALVPSLTAAGARTGALFAGSETSLDQVFVAAGVFEKRPSWRVGNDPVLTGEEPLWSLRYRAFVHQDGTPEVAPASAAVVGTATAANNVNSKIRAEAMPSGNTAASTSAARIAPADYDPAVDQTITFRPTDASKYLPANAIVAYVVIPEINVTDALALSEEINGQLHYATSDTPEQLNGAFVFRAPAGTENTTTAFYYLHHR